MACGPFDFGGWFFRPPFSVFRVPNHPAFASLSFLAIRQFDTGFLQKLKNVLLQIKKLVWHKLIDCSGTILLSD
jgi:hypothetical protein